MKPFPTKRIILAVILGLTTTITIAWGCAIWTGTNPLWTKNNSVCIEMEELDSDFPAEWKMSLESYFPLIRRIEVYGMGMQITCNSLIRLTERDLNYGPDRMFVIHQAGWPYRAFECNGRIKRTTRLSTGWTDSTQWNDALTVPDFLMPGECKPDYFFLGYTPPIPYHPLWTGLLLNTTLFTLAWSILLLGPTTLQHYLREHKNRCTTCGYNLHNLKSNRCPECGTTVISTELTKTP